MTSAISGQPHVQQKERAVKELSAPKSKNIRKKSAEIRVDTEAIGKRWDQIKSEERQKRRSSGEKPVHDVILMYEVNTRRKSMSAVEQHQMSRPMSRTMSDSVITERRVTWVVMDYGNCYKFIFVGCKRLVLTNLSQIRHSLSFAWTWNKMRGFPLSGLFIWMRVRFSSSVSVNPQVAGHLWIISVLLTIGPFGEMSRVLIIMYKCIRFDDVQPRVSSRTDLRYDVSMEEYY
jgi:hypothetical protein